MNDDKIGAWIFGCCSVSFIIGFIAGSVHCQSVLNKKAVDAGAAKYIVDERTGSTQFVFITNNIPAK